MVSFVTRMAQRFAAVVRRRPKMHLALAVLVLLVLCLLVIAWTEGRREFRDDTADAGAAMVTDDPFGDNYSHVRVAELDQGWSNSQSLWFYSTTQGSDLVPYD